MAKDSYEKSGDKGMSKKEIYEKIDSFKTDKAKFNYMKSLEPKIGSAKKETQNAFYETLGDLNAKKGASKQAAEAYEKAGREKEAKKIYKKVGDKLYSGAFKYRGGKKTGGAKNLKKAAEAYEEAEDFSKMNKALDKLGNNYYEQGEEEKAAESYKKGGGFKKVEKIADKKLKKGDVKKAKELYESINRFDKAAKAVKEDSININKIKEAYEEAANKYSKVLEEPGKAKEVLKDLADFYENEDMENEAMKVHRRIKNLKKNK